MHKVTKATVMSSGKKQINLSVTTESLSQIYNCLPDFVDDATTIMKFLLLDHCAFIMPCTRRVRVLKKFGLRVLVN